MGPIVKVRCQPGFRRRLFATPGVAVGVLGGGFRMSAAMRSLKITSKRARQKKR